MMKNFDVRKYTIPLAKDYLRVPFTKRAKYALVTIKKFLEKNTRVERGKVLIGEELNQHIWSRGIKNPPRRVKVEVKKRGEDELIVNLEGASLEIKKKEKKEEDKGKSKNDKKEPKGKKEEVKEEKKEETIMTKPVKEKKPASKLVVKKTSKSINKY
ncbi:hypothetical protein COX58_00785 [archaeon CG_4_10_14_0_2_um_filter_Archaea_38_6]|nr:MAG: hypothetical protein COS83_04895 [archaeon CG07_land_8_20_14_0_80_38_8]PIU88303.1 MAG: hypothetical protein COS64_03965 [archaeon CG06_land_8_20_14_3_00_37_11]PIX42634.1 MAG: hypothetical protein COZ55_01880 [archaeon CG_4_8_14_3_um_filter_38_5]PJA22944.1 MAG: hypothetical protein COX58_00785 [archaeon CG_4_10_14_0_2_um_filter_Archaea_38_6]